MYGRNGDDTLTGGAGDDFLHGGAGNDKLDGGTGINRLYGGEGDDTLMVNYNARDNVFEGGKGNDILHGSYNSDTYVFNLGDGQDTIVETGANSDAVDVLRFGTGIVAGDIQVQKRGTDLVFAHANGTDQVLVRNWFSSDTNSLHGATPSARLERVEFADGTAWTQKQVESAVVSQGTTENDKLIGWSGNDIMHGGAGNDTLDGGTGTNHLYGGEGDDTLMVNYNARDNVFEGGKGNDTLHGSYNSDTYVFNLGDGQDTIVETGANSDAVDVLRFGTGIVAGDIQVQKRGTDLVFAHANGTDQVLVRNWFSSDTNSLHGATPSARLERVEFADGTAWTQKQVESAVVSQGTTENDKLIGWNGSDIMYGGAGNDTLDGGTGTNRLYGGEGDDTLMVNYNARDNVFEGGKGNDILHGSYNSDTYVFNLGDGQDTIVETGANSDAVDVLRFGTGIVAGDIQVQKRGTDLVFAHANGTDQVLVRNWFSSDTNSLHGATPSARLERVEFADGTAWTQKQVESAVVSQGTTENDKLIGWNGSDIMYGGAGNDTLDGGTGTNRLYGGEGDDTLMVNYNARDNVFEGGKGNDILHGSYNSDTYVFNLGDGQDTIVETGANSDAVDVLRFGTGIVAGDIQVQKRGTDLVFAHANGTDQVLVRNWFSSDTNSLHGATPSARLERVEFADGTAWTQKQVESAVVSQGTTENDKLIGWNGSDIMYGGAGNDTLDGGTGTNRLYGGEGDDTLMVNYNARDNVFEGGKGNDILHGSYNSDTYVFNLGDGQDTIVETGANSDAVDVLRFGTGIVAGDIQVQKRGTDLVFAHANGTDQVLVRNWFSSDTNSLHGATPSARLERVEFADGTAWTQKQVESAVVSQGTTENDKLIGWNGSDIMYGGAGNDTLDGGTGTNRLYGGEGDDTLMVNYNARDNVFEGGKGNDILHGSYNSDTYVFNLGDGQDTIVETGANSDAVDTLRFGADLSPENLWFQRNGQDLEISILGSEDRMTVSNWYAGSGNRVEVFQTHAGLALTESRVQSLVNAMAAFGVPSGAEVNLTQTQRESLDVVIAANWQ